MNGSRRSSRSRRTAETFAVARALTRSQLANGGETMQLGMVGLGRMGANLVRRLMRDGHECVVYDVNAETVAQLVSEGAIGSDSLEDFVAKLSKPRAAWVMVPAAITGKIVDQLVDAGLEPGGVFGLERGFCLMIGGEKTTVHHLDPIFKTIAPGVAGAERTNGGNGKPSTAENGYLHCGPSGAGHFVKMVHNGIEYGIMAAYAEGLNILHKANVGKQEMEVNAETSPLQDAEYYQYDIDVPDVAEVWRRGSVVASWLLDLTAAALKASPDLSDLGGRVSDSGEGRWTIRAAIDEGVPTPVLSASLYERFSSRGEAHYADQLLSAMRQQFGGHLEQPAAKA